MVFVGRDWSSSGTDPAGVASAIPRKAMIPEGNRRSAPGSGRRAGLHHKRLVMDVMAGITAA